jgi:hypothetical protein
MFDMRHMIEPARFPIIGNRLSAIPPSTSAAQIGRVEMLPLDLGDDAVDDAGAEFRMLRQLVADVAQKGVALVRRKSAPRRT